MAPEHGGRDCESLSLPRPYRRSFPSRQVDEPRLKRGVQIGLRRGLLSCVQRRPPRTASKRKDLYDRDYGWRSINQRQAQLDQRIDRSLRNGAISRREANGLRNEFRAIARLENHYRRGGLTRWERADLDRRFDGLQARIRMERRDRDNRRW